MDSKVQVESVPAQNRIVIGDVGSGKTIVGFFVALGFLNGVDTSQGFTQVALVAPTEILAAQHYSNLRQLLTNASQSHNVTTIYVSAKKFQINDEIFSKSKFETALNHLTGSHIMWIGTHALFHRKDVIAELVLVDEQHRFGVNQRKELTTRLAEEDKFAHFISFSATPIPRTVALAAFRDLKPLFLQKLKRQSSIHTSITTFEQLELQVVARIRDALEAHQKIYIVCPRVEDDEESDLWSIKQAEKFFTAIFGETILSLHGKQKNKDTLIEEFKKSPTHHILVATSVIEVGVDVESATIMIILNAERFGLAALHQIRGRIGRNNLQSNYCFLVSTEQGQYSRRLRYLVESQDGFWLAQKDLELRGAGDLTGKLQSGYTEDIDIFMNVSEEELASIQQLVDSLDWERLDSELPRLGRYLDSQLGENWNE